MHIQIPSPPQADRVAIFGMSGEGKSYLAKALLRSKRRAIIVDTKKDEDWSDVVDAQNIIHGDEIYPRVFDTAAGGRFLWQPPPEFVVDMEARDRFFRNAYQTGGRVIYVDEFEHVAESAGRFPRWLRILSISGRSAGAGLWGTAKDAFNVPSFVASQAPWIFTFALPRSEARDRVDGFAQRQLPWERIPQGSRGFMIIHQGHVTVVDDGLDPDHPFAPRSTTPAGGRALPVQAPRFMEG